MIAGGLGWGMAMKVKRRTAVPQLKAKERFNLRKRLQGAGIGLEHPQMVGGSSLDTSSWMYNRRRPAGGKVPKGFQPKGRAYRGLRMSIGRRFKV